MENFSIWIFVLKYSICLVLLLYMIKINKTETLLKSIVITFIGLTIVIIGNLLLSIPNTTYRTNPFYYINFIDFVSIALIINLFLKKRN